MPMPKRFRQSSGNGAEKRVVRLNGRKMPPKKRKLYDQAMGISRQIAALREQREIVMNNKQLTSQQRVDLLAKNGGEIQRLKQELSRLEGELGKP